MTYISPRTEGCQYIPENRGILIRIFLIVGVPVRVPLFLFHRAYARTPLRIVYPASLAGTPWCPRQTWPAPLGAPGQLPRPREHGAYAIRPYESPTRTRQTWSAPLGALTFFCFLFLCQDKKRKCQDKKRKCQGKKRRLEFSPLTSPQRPTPPHRAAGDAL